MGNRPAPAPPVAPLPAPPSGQSIIDALAQPVALWTLAPAATDLVPVSPARSVSFPSGAPLYVRFCAQLI